MDYTAHEETLLEGGPKHQRSWFARISPFLLVSILILAIVAVVYSVKSYNNSGSNGSTPTEPTTPGLINVGVDKNVVREYYASGAYDAELWGLAGIWMNYWTSQTYVAKNTVVFDIDETVLNNMGEILNNDFSFLPQNWDPWVNSSAAPAINQTVQIFHYLVNTGYSVILLTGRRDTQMTATVVNLQRQGIVGYTQLIVRSPSEYSMTATQYKSSHRQQLQMSGNFNIVGCIGDQISDCAGGFAGYIMKIPNYAYFIA